MERLKPDAFYYSAQKEYWIRRGGDRGGYMCATLAALRLYLRELGYSGQVPKDKNLSPLEEQILYVMREKEVSYAGPLAGFPVGFFDVCGSPVLVTSESAPMASKDVPWPTLEKMLNEQFGEQLPYFLGWVRCALVALTTREFRPGQMLVFAGEGGSGKSLLQNLITEILGGRLAKPYRYMTGATQFNSELFGAEHLAIEDEASSTRLEVRRAFGNFLKNLVFNETQSFHAKGRSAMTLRCFWRITVSLNDEPENLMVLPPMDDSLRAKISIFRIGRPSVFENNNSLEARRKFRETLTAELPGFLHMLKKWRIPKRLRDERCGITYYHHAELLSELNALSPEDSLWTLILDSGILKNFAWEGSANELRKALEDYDRAAAERVFTFSTAPGVYLARLKGKQAGISSKWDSGKRIWRIEKPSSGR